MLIISFDSIVFKYVSNLLYEFNHTLMSSIIYITIIVLAITAALYVYNVYIVNIGGGKNNSEKNKLSNGDSSSTDNTSNGISSSTNQNKNISGSRRQRD
jgi:hypothetical protein